MRQDDSDVFGTSIYFEATECIPALTRESQDSEYSPEKALLVSKGNKVFL